MTAYDFLKALPAVLGITGFFAYLWVGQSKVGGEILKRIVDKLRAAPNINIQEYGPLTPTKIQRLINTDQRVRNAVNKDDADLLRLLIILQYALTALVLLVCASLIGMSVWLYLRPAPLSIVQNGPEPIAKEGGGLLVDLDPIYVQWIAKGREENVSVFLENVDSRARTKKQSVASNVRSVTFESASVHDVATTRAYGAKNRIRAVIEWPGGACFSDPKELAVGIKVELRFNGRLISPDAPNRQIHTLFATIDGTTEPLPKEYTFFGDFVALSSKGQPVVFPLKSNNYDGEIVVTGLDRVDWLRPFGFVYSGPDDPRIVRTAVFH